MADIRTDREKGIGRISGPKYCPSCMAFNSYLPSRKYSRQYYRSTGSLIQCQSACAARKNCHWFMFDENEYEKCKMYSSKYDLDLTSLPFKRNSVVGPARCAKVQWSSWSDWTNCQGNCGSGLKMRRRECLKNTNFAHCSALSQNGYKETQRCPLNPCSQDQDQTLHFSAEEEKHDSSPMLLMVILVTIVALSVIGLLIFFKKRSQSQNETEKEGTGAARKMSNASVR